MEEIFDQMSAEVDQNTVDKQCAEIERKNLLIAYENLIANCLSNQLLFAVEQSRCLDLEAEISKLQNENQKDVNDEMIRGFNKLEMEYLNLQLKYQHLQENFGNNKSQTSQDVPEFDSFFKINNLEAQLQEKDNVIRNLKAQVSKMNDRSCETYNAKDVTALIEQNERVRAEIEKVKQGIQGINLKVATRSSVKPKVLAPDMYAIDVKPIPPPLRNNRSAHLNYINHLKDSVEIVREIVEEARVVKPLDNALNYACRTDRPLVSGLRLFKTYDSESFKAQEVCGKVPRDIQASFFIMMMPVHISSGLILHHDDVCSHQFRPCSSS
ncbi:hypothetical protein Tco_0967627 [Tanacetum coccineum]